MASDAIKAALAANRDVSKEAPGPRQDCSDVIHISVFFDGTGNNKSEDEVPRKWSNPARMWRAAEMAAPRGEPIYPIYISGVGTPFNGSVKSLGDFKDAWIEDHVKGMAAGGGGDRRMEFGADKVNARLRDVLIANAQRAGGDLKKYADQSRSKSFAEVNDALGKHRLIKVINLSVFGFSRGAALARAFANRVINQCKESTDGLIYQGHPIRVNFLGLFDTVASFGVPAQNIRYPWDERDLIVSPKVERCVHYVAGHELRFAFPVDLIRMDGKLNSKWEEKTYPGVHSDVGGGYDPDAQNISNNYARIPMRDMMKEAIGSGARMLSYEQIAKTGAQIFAERFECMPSTEAAYRGYMACWGTHTGTIEEQAKRHRKLLYTAYGTLHRLGIDNPGDTQRKADWYKNIGPKGMAWEVGKYRKAAALGKQIRWANPANTYAYWVKPEEWQLQAWDSPAPKGVLDFIQAYVHDSKVDFIGNVGDPFSYFKSRGITESTRSVWQEAGDWIHDQAQVVTQASKSAYEASKRQATKAAEATAQAGREAADMAERKAKEAAAYAERKKQEAMSAAQRVAHATEEKAREAAAYAKQKAQDAADAAQEAAHVAEQKAKELATYAKQKAQQAAEATEQLTKEAGTSVQQSASEAADATRNKAQHAAIAAQESMHELKDNAERYVEAGISWVKQVVENVTHKVERVASN
jgi:hypothetical protein